MIRFLIAFLLVLFFISDKCFALEEAKRCRGNSVVTGPCYWARGSWFVSSAGGEEVLHLKKGSGVQRFLVHESFAHPKKFDDILTRSQPFSPALGEFMVCPLPPGLPRNENHGIQNFVCIEDIKELSILPPGDPDNKECAFLPVIEYCKYRGAQR